jgi:hypothetical protein
MVSPSQILALLLIFDQMQYNVNILLISDISLVQPLDDSLPFWLIIGYLVPTAPQY